MPAPLPSPTTANVFQSGDPEADPTLIPNIRRVDITLGVETDEVDPNTQQGRRMIYSSSVIVRNHSITL